MPLHGAGWKVAGPVRDVAPTRAHVRRPGTEPVPLHSASSENRGPASAKLRLASKDLGYTIVTKQSVFIRVDPWLSLLSHRLRALPIFVEKVIVRRASRANRGVDRMILVLRKF